MDARDLEQGDEIFYEGYTYQVAEVVRKHNNNQIGVYDSDDLEHIDYINPKNASKVSHCPNCQGGGYPVCFGSGKIIEP